MIRPFHLAIGLAVLPTIVGSGIFIYWLFTASAILEAAGLWTILIGLLLTIASLIALAAHYWHSKKSGMPGKKRSAEIGCALFLMLLNFPLAFFYISIAGDISGRLMIVVENRGAVPIESFVLIETRPGEELGPINPQRRAWRRVSPAAQKLTFSMKQGAVATKGVIEDYLSGSGGTDIVGVDGVGSFAVQVSSKITPAFSRFDPEVHRSR